MRIGNAIQTAVLSTKRKRIYKPTDYTSWNDHGYTGGYTTPYNDKFNCKHEPLVGCTVGGVMLYPTWGKSITAAMLENFDVVVPLTDTASFSEVYSNYCGIVMWFPIRDMTAPDPTRLRVNAQRILDFARTGAKVAFWCVGSHGRTGTVLATCIGLAEPDVVDPIAETRTRHCKHAIETNAQEICIFKALGREVPDQYKPKPVTQGTWSKQTAWPSLQQDIPKLVQGGYAVCSVCGETEDGTRKLHWIGRERCHWDCAVDNTKKKKATQSTNTKALTPSQIKNTLSTEACMYCARADGELVRYTMNKVFVGYAHRACHKTEQGKTKNELKSSAKPSADSPPRNDTIVDVANDIPQDDDDSSFQMVSEADYRAFVKLTRPFNKNWNTDTVSLLATDNERDQFGDLICPLCERLVIDPEPMRADVQVIDKKTYTVHADCDEFEDDPDTMVLCRSCLDGEASNVYDGCCSKECQQQLRDQNNEVTKA
jgi:hypothetical protein